jgi:hypothetical protein
MTATATAGADVSAATAALAINIDTMVASPAGLDLDAASDLGDFSNDDITSDNTPTISGTGVVGAMVALTSDLDGAIGTAVVDGVGNWTITSSVLSDGVNTITAVQTEDAGNTIAPSDALIVTIDTTAPAAPAALDLNVASDLGDSNSDDITAADTPMIDATGEIAATVTLTSGVDGVVGTATVDGTGNWSIVATAMSDGVHTITATQANDAGAVSAASAALVVTIDTAAPAAPPAPDLDAGSDDGASNTDDITSVVQPFFNGSGLTTGFTVKIFADAVEVGSGVVDGGGNYSIQASVLASGAYTITATQTDLAGNEIPASAGLAVTIL